MSPQWKPENCTEILYTSNSSGQALAPRIPSCEGDDVEEDWSTGFYLRMCFQAYCNIPYRAVMD